MLLVALGTRMMRKRKRKKRNRKRIQSKTPREFDPMVGFDDSTALQDLMDNYNLDNKKASKDGHIIKSFICKFSKRKKGFACPV